MDDNKIELSERLKTVISFSERLPIESKRANNWAWAKRRADAYDLQYPDAPSPEYLENVADSYRIMSGVAMKNFTKKAKQNAAITEKDLLSEGLAAPNTKLEHFDIVSPYISQVDGDRRRTRLQFVVTDSSIGTQNYYKRTATDKLRDFLTKGIVEPARMLAMAEWAMASGVQDMSQVTPEQMAEAEQQIQAAVDSQIPKEIADFFKTGRTSPLEIEGQAIAEALVRHFDLKTLFDDAYLHTYPTDAAIFEIGMRRNMPYVEWVDPTEFTTGGTKNKFINQNPWFRRTTKMHPAEILDRWGDQFNKEDWRKFNEMVQGRGNSPDSEKAKDEQIVMRMDIAGLQLLDSIDLKTPEGQLAHTAFVAKYGGEAYGEFDHIRVAKIVWKSRTKMKVITRGYNDGSVREEIFAEHYQFNPDNGDLEERIIWVPQYYQVVKIGDLGAEDKAIYVDVGPVPYQRRDPSDPYKVYSPFVGGYFGDLFGHGERRAALDRIKPWVHEFNLQMRTIREREATDIGKVVLMTVAAKPKDWSWGKFLAVVRATKFLPINTQQAGLTPMDVNFFKEIDLSNLYDLVPRLNYLNYILMRIAELLSVNSARLGMQAASTSVTNNMQNLRQAYTQTHSRGVWMDKIAEQVIEHLTYYGRMAAKNGNIFMRYVLDDLSIAHIDIDIDGAESPLYSTRVLTDTEELEKLDIGKNLLFPYLQNPNSGMSYKYALKSMIAATKGELLDIANQAELEQQVQAAQASDMQKQSAAELQKMKLDYEAALAELKTSLDMMRDAQNNEAKKEMAALQSMTLANANDIDQNLENDYLQSAREDRAAKREEIFIKDRLERDKLGLEAVWKERELDILAKQVEKLAQKAKETKKKAK